MEQPKQIMSSADNVTSYTTNSTQTTSTVEWFEIKQLTEEEKALVTASMKALASMERRYVIDQLSVWLFRNIRGISEKFPTLQGIQRKDCPGEEHFLSHAMAVFMTLEQIINVLDDPEKIRKKIREVVTIHVHRRVGPVGIYHFKARYL